MLPDGRSRPNVTWQPASQVGFEAIGLRLAEWWPYARRRWPISVYGESQRGALDELGKSWITSDAGYPLRQHL
jgi:hypothetical protein